MINFSIKVLNSLSQWSRGKNALVRLPFFLFFLYIFINHLKNPVYKSILGPLNLGIHEFGHLVFSFFGMFVNIAGGTIVQLLAPIYGIYNFKKIDDYFSAVLCIGWFSTNCYDVATYVQDARAMALPLVSPFGGAGGSVYHDWNYLLSKMNALHLDIVIGNWFRAIGFLSILFCLSLCSWMLFSMLKSMFSSNQ